MAFGKFKSKIKDRALEWLRTRAFPKEAMEHHDVVGGHHSSGHGGKARMTDEDGVHVEYPFALTACDLIRVHR